METNSNHPETFPANWRGGAMKSFLHAAAFALVVAKPAHATETVAYTYDALGRLVQVTHAGSVNNGLNTSYNPDKADNRVNVTTTGS
ncbi:MULTISPECIES: RHS repeat domain-containing protein [unclassified Novosphingobium]|uniref:RHS repeat domain-containing protein n=1 Tax=unclassified Novosphingobium TaxID=2644732 RepID=UPI0017FBC861|nr:MULTISPECIES: RHS repeat domain-containing protein [unclassified Novosphingobium]MBB3360369.1 hypothetical protein [Novosphingobium sp. BK256]MBB3376708.1 hypothetical protein [Novosphingobium sp. BK280]MBB3381121.1 hypothetical protein [Novosphingobium sp. BK258]MBB3422772.1 hypothetical protein [Novosphingobium sp. BK267]MBB3451484.1 hypothetical protein [Novosphingobium sp. BK352]